jgi:hypothetical protein
LFQPVPIVQTVRQCRRQPSLLTAGTWLTRWLFLLPGAALFLIDLAMMVWLLPRCIAWPT